MRAPIVGGGSSGNVTLNWSQTAGDGQFGTLAVSDPISGVSATREGTDLRVSFANALPGAEFTFFGMVDYNASNPLVVNAPKYVDAPGVTVAFAPDSQIQAGTVLSGVGTRGVKVIVRFTDQLALNLAPGRCRRGHLRDPPVRVGTKQPIICPACRAKNFPDLRGSSPLYRKRK